MSKLRVPKPRASEYSEPHQSKHSEPASSRHTEVIRKTPSTSSPSQPTISITKNAADDELMNILFTMEESEPQKGFHFSQKFLNQFTTEANDDPENVSSISNSPCVEDCSKPPLLPIKKEDDV